MNDAASRRPAAGTVAVLDIHEANELARLTSTGSADDLSSSANAALVRKLLAGTATGCGAKLLDDPDAEALSRADWLVCIEGTAKQIANVSAALSRPVLHLHSWIGEDAVWSELARVQADGRRERLIGSASMLKPHRPAESLAEARRRANGFVRRWSDRLPHGLPLAAAGGPPPAPATPGATQWRALTSRGAKIVERLRSKQQWGLVIDKPAHALAPVDFSRALSIFPARDRFWADPFPVVEQGRTYVFFEELPFDTNRGHISMLEYLPDGTVTEPVAVLKRPYHLSYPFMFMWQGAWHMMPECSENEQLEVYRCERWPDRWTLVAEHMPGQRFADPSLFEHAGRWWMFATRGDAGASLDDELHLFHADSPLGPWEPHPANPVVDDARWARPAGRPFVYDGKLLRPAQNCGQEYGRSVSVREVLELDAHHYRERELVHLHGDPSRGMKRLHTLNFADGIRVTDAMKLV